MLWISSGLRTRSNSTASSSNQPESPIAGAAPKPNQRTTIAETTVFMGVLRRSMPTTVCESNIADAVLSLSLQLGMSVCQCGKLPERGGQRTKAVVRQFIRRSGPQRGQYGLAAAAGGCWRSSSRRSRPSAASRGLRGCRQAEACPARPPGNPGIGVIGFLVTTFLVGSSHGARLLRWAISRRWSAWGGWAG